MWYKCRNASCARAGWCKRISYTPDNYRIDLFDCNDHNGWYMYVRNKAREIYERENNESFDQQEHENNNRESGVREDNSPDTRAGRHSNERDTTHENSVLQFFERSDRRGERTCHIEIDAAHWEGVQIFFDVVRPLPSRENTNVLQNSTLYGVSSSELIVDELNDRPAYEAVQQNDAASHIDISTEGSGNYTSTWRQDTTDN